ncbi:hypothetical protein KAFR_0B05310 [Kazachstania africana CBS 2517]|uniref:Golgi apparatus membrane protein TVP15 n=1 Tax=Kazachstania africana (strain ATCC 22294 / BCRC 22015 / CBS 2517 / CECT 1963 / NBRC 1671 / NRRL Y-8276) TaxID=1071382 RepID=H2AR26_KAZAF|nr:hypothetical protein KAFR_0B05310 [Kazachstania africana CBS 2517]CCF56826.1 hypothetical protein KAFR_0B05310 [Kazachstania africana CBS 2517]
MSSIPPEAFKFVHISIGSLAILASLSQFLLIFTNFNAFLLGLYSLALSIPVVYLEFKIPPNIYNYASFYFSFLGRGCLNILIALILYHQGFFRILTTILLIFNGIAYIIFHFLPFINEPENFKLANPSLSLNDNEFDDDDEVV